MISNIESEDLRRAAEMLAHGDYTCVLCRGDSTAVSNQTGVRPLLGFLADGTDYTGFAAADRIVGKAAAMLYVLLKVSSVYACVLSEAGAQTLRQYGIPVVCDVRTPHIMNRAGTGPCPMELAVRNVSDPEDAYRAISDQLEHLKLMPADS